MPQMLIGAFQSADFVLWDSAANLELWRFRCGGAKRPHGLVADRRGSFVFFSPAPGKKRRKWAKSKEQRVLLFSCGRLFHSIGPSCLIEQRGLWIAGAALPLLSPPARRLWSSTPPSPWTTRFGEPGNRSTSLPMAAERTCDASLNEGTPQWVGFSLWFLFNTIQEGCLGPAKTTISYGKQGPQRTPL